MSDLGCTCPDEDTRYGNCPAHGAKIIRDAALGLMGAMTAADDQAQAMTDAELGELLLTGRWTTIEVHEAGRRLVQRDRT